MKNSRSGGYKLRIFCDDSVPAFGPTLPDPPEFTVIPPPQIPISIIDSQVPLIGPQNLSNFREFLLVKLINGEKATFQTPTFSKKRERTLEMLIKDLCDDYMQDSKTVLIGSSTLRCQGTEWDVFRFDSRSC